MAELSAGHLRLVVVAPQGSVAKAYVTELTAPGVMGEFGVLPGHIPFLSAMASGVLAYVEDGQTRLIAVGPGYVEVGTDEQVVVLTSQSARPGDIDVIAVTREEQEAGAKLARLSPEAPPAEQAQLAAQQAWARARREAAERQRALSQH